MTSARTETPAPRPSSRFWTLETATGEFDVEVIARDDDRLSSVLPALSTALGSPQVQLWHGSAVLDDDLPLTAPQLAHGSVLGVDRPSNSMSGPAPSALELHVVGGSDAGRRLPLGFGEHVVGRGGSVDIALRDPDVSRQHLLIRVGGGAVTAADPGSTNGTLLGDRPLTPRPRDWPLGLVARLGASGLTLSGPAGYPAQTEPCAGGRMTLRPTVRMTPARPAVEVHFPRPPAEPARRRLAWAAVALPALGGIAMAVLLHTPHFLFFALLSPAMALSTWASDRWSGRRTRRQESRQHAADVRIAEDRLAEAVRADVMAADAAHPDLAVLTAAASRRSHLLWGRRAGETDALTVRLGLAQASTAVTRVEADGSRAPVTDPHLPVALDLRASGGLAVVGPRRLGLEVLAGVLAQLAVLHAPGEVDLLLLAGPENLPSWRWARWLPHLPREAVHVGSAGGSGHPGDPYVALERLIRARRTAGAGDPSGPRSWLAVVVDRPLDPRSARLLREALAVGVITLTLAHARHALPASPGALLSFTGETGDRAALSRTAAPEVRDVVVDRLPIPVAAALSRDLAPLQPGASESELPRRLRLLDLPHGALACDGEDVAGIWPRDRARLAATVGRSASGPLEIDLCRLGPHALVAGTTGSGKSEFLQSLIAGLALAHPPDRCSFLLVDYKGGAAFGEAAALPHTVGVLTDLDGRTTERALRSLTAELLRREALLARHQVADVRSLPDDVDLARLVIVVDEFATLAEELPAFVPGLVGIAQRGRSLGVHLILATQRPAGVVSPEIRANCTLRICLRTTDEADSRDVLGLPDAAHLPLDRPGRAYLRAGAEPPVLFQVARVAETDADAAADVPVVRPWVWPFAPAVPADAAPNRADSDLGRLCAAIGRHAVRSGIRSPHRPWRPPLPEHLTHAELDCPEILGSAAAVRPENLRIGVIDRPDLQAWEVLELDLTAGGGWLAVGSGRSGRSSLLRTVLGEAVHHMDPGQLEVHVLDHGGGGLAAEAAELPHTGTTVAADDPLRTVRLLARLTEEVAVRRAGLRSEPVPRLLLLVDGAESVMEQLDEYDPSGGSAAFLRLIRDGAAAGLTCLLTADRAIPGARLASAVRQRLILPLADTADYVVAGVPAAAVPAVRPPGRALLGESAHECQIALPRPLPTVAAGDRVRVALCIPALPERPTLLLPSATTPAAVALRLPVGPGGDDGGVLAVDLARAGGLLVAGPPGSGRSTAVHGFAQHLHAGGVPVVHLSPRTPSSSRGHCLDPADDVALAAWLANLEGGPGAVVVDDLDLLTDTTALSRLPVPGPGSRVVLLVTAAAAELARQFQGPVAALRRQRTALLLCPAPGDADLLGIRLPRTPVPRRPGSGWLVTPGATERVQVAGRRVAQDQSSSSAGPISCVAYQASS